MILREVVKDRGDKTNSALFVLKPRSCTIWSAMSWTRGSRFKVERRRGCCLGRVPSVDTVLGGVGVKPRVFSLGMMARENALISFISGDVFGLVGWLLYFKYFILGVEDGR